MEQQTRQNQGQNQVRQESGLAVAVANSPAAAVTAFSSYQAFQGAYQMAKYLACSSIVPAAFQGEAHVGDALVALEMAQRVNASPLAVMQSLYVVHGKPAWSTSFLVACLNSTGRFSPLHYRMTGEPGKDSRGCVAWARDSAGELLESPEVTIAMAKADGWYSRQGSKWQTLPELMLRYRAATLFVRLYAPEVSLGMHTLDEMEDAGKAAPAPAHSHATINVTPPRAPGEAEAADQDALLAEQEYIKRQERG